MIETRVTGRASVWLATCASIVLYLKDREKYIFQPVELLKHDKKQLVCSNDEKKRYRQPDAAKLAFYFVE